RSMCILHPGSGKMQLFRGSKHQEMVFGHHVAVVLVNLAEAGGCSAHALQDGLPLTHRQLRVTLPETRKPMNSRTLLGLAAILGVFSISAHAQAAAEAALAHATQEKTTAGTANLNCAGKAAPTQYKSAVTLSFPK